MLIFSIIVFILNAICAYMNIASGDAAMAFVNGLGVAFSINWVIDNLSK
jgi:hypothetical protein